MSPNTAINDSALDDMHQEGEYLTTQEADSAALATIDIDVIDNVTVPPSAVEASVSALEGHDGELAVTHGNVTKLFDMRDVADRIMVQESISQGDAEEIDRVYGGLGDEVAPVSAYTEVPTRANLSATKEFIAKKLESHFMEARNRHVDYIAKTNDHAKNLRVVLSRSVPEAIEELEALRIVCSRDLEKAASSKNFLAYRKAVNPNVTQPQPLVDLKKVCLYNQNFAEEFEIPNIGEKLPSSSEVSAFREAYHSTPFKSLLAKATSSAAGLASLHDAYHNFTGENDRSPNGLTYIQALSLFASGELGYFLTNCLEALQKLSVDVEAYLPAVLSDKLENTPEATERLSDSATLMSDYYEALLQLEKFRVAAYMLAYRAKIVLDGFRAVLES